MKQFDLMRTLIQKTAPAESFCFSYDVSPKEDGTFENYMIVQNNDKKFRFSVLETSVWTDVKRVLTKKMTGVKGEWTCGICCEISSKRVNCNRCSNDTCGECYIRSFVEGQGVIVCPWCRSRTGQRFPPHMIMGMVDTIRSKLSASI